MVGEIGSRELGIDQSIGTTWRVKLVAYHASDGVISQSRVLNHKAGLLGMSMCKDI